MLRASRLLLVAAAAAGLGCAAQQSAKTSDALFGSSVAALAREHAPDLYAQAEIASEKAEAALRSKDQEAADELLTAAHLWLAAGAVEAERFQLDRELAALQLEEERWATQLARDQEASATVARDISRYEARAVALREVDRISEIEGSSTVSGATLEAVLTRVRFNLALAEAFGAPDARLSALRDRTETIARKGSEPARSVEALLLSSEGLLGEIRRDWPEPRPGSSTELVETAVVLGFVADRGGTGVVVRSERFFSSNGRVSNATVNRFHGLVSAFPHGPVACQVVVPELRSEAWTRRVAQLVERLRPMNGPARIYTSMVATQSLSAGTVQCTFAAYREP
jgi:hypothetical protein